MPLRGQEKLGDENLRGRPKGDQTEHLRKGTISSKNANLEKKMIKKKTIEARLRMWVSSTNEGKIQERKTQEQHKTQKWAKVKTSLKSRSP